MKLYEELGFLIPTSAQIKNFTNIQFNSKSGSVEFVTSQLKQEIIGSMSYFLGVVG